MVKFYFLNFDTCRLVILIFRVRICFQLFGITILDQTQYILPKVRYLIENPVWTEHYNLGYQILWSYHKLCVRKENEKKNQRFIRLFGQIFTYYIANGVEKFCPNAIPAQCQKLTIMGARKSLYFICATYSASLKKGSCNFYLIWKLSH